MNPANAIPPAYQEALDSLLEKLKQDPYVLAVILYGSLAYDVVWEKSDIDLGIVTQETRKENFALALVENGINIHAFVMPRSEFKKAMEGSTQGSFTHSMFMKGNLLFTRDETLETLWENRLHFGARDREVRLLQAANVPVFALPKAQKWLYARNDPQYSYFFVMTALTGLALMETVLSGDIPTREVMAQALRHNPTFFKALYTDLLDVPKTYERVDAAIHAIEDYLRERIEMIFRPVFDYLAESDGPRSAKEVDRYFKNQMNVEGASFVCEWLADEGYIHKLALPVRITEKSRVDVEEMAFLYDPPQA